MHEPTMGFSVDQERMKAAEALMLLARESRPLINTAQGHHAVLLTTNTTTAPDLTMNWSMLPTHFDYTQVPAYPTPVNPKKESWAEPSQEADPQRHKRNWHGRTLWTEDEISILFERWVQGFTYHRISTESFPYRSSASCTLKIAALKKAGRIVHDEQAAHGYILLDKDYGVAVIMDSRKV
ncbi:hypothetical protein BU24DRAFT_413255 [Aaosphaeria arxii CBS 175.79]|uniref:Uncharacterized protein n=1 Tax=Aaosphaeria arxii CBS 175.79 TaxID=1450172 RepID=A0A6A5XFA9_9PLEO|nr:uncharacterized protein BU24DRAFT_413255 [Aaosphaeria arxii CBS 175.79]KAF2011620.1 hypothetical protein BU24DRAFT_413255 [Aaosphaeria arxii CBS 175.79]